ncbi:glycosyltransferase family 4 protein [Leifsonia shinshuensis]|uniref:glycosyltransferase family 4 protein n=1 Tax=Leifsonia shinshuensis TaxID=150026 RepID=UPI001F5123F2|nr:glycosyltransferase family 4 protein [Leifsonia shinshuensis]MCI0158208.1 glycosyltransferase family 4 protein [Leifsonia shinshuensis]
MSGIRVLVATRLYAPEVAAAAFRLRALARGLAANGSEVRVVTTRPPRHSPKPPKDRGVRVSRFPVLRDSGGNVRGYLQYLSFDLPLFFRLLFARGDLVICEPPPTTGTVVALTSWLRRRPYVHYAADIWTDGVVALGAPRFVVAIMRTLERFTLRNAALVLAVSDGVAERVSEFGVPAERITNIGNGVDMETFRLDGEVQHESRPTFVYTGSMSEWQTPGVFVKALPRVLEEFPSARIHFFGQGVEEEATRQLAEQLAPGSVEFGGVVAPAVAARWLRGATAALASITPGVGYDFAKPTKIYAAASCGAPVVFAGIGAGAQLVAESGLGWRAGYDPAEVAEAMIAAARAEANGERAARAAERSRWVADNASLDAIGDRGAKAALATVGNSAPVTG